MAGGAGERLFPLTRDRAKPAVVFGGKYRIIDFTLSNCVNSGIRKIFVLPQYKSYSLIEHIRDAWSILNPELGEYVSNLPPQMRVSEEWYRGTADAVYQNLYHLRQVDADNVVILSADHIYKMDYTNFIRYHRGKKADMTVASIEVDLADAMRFGVIEADRDCRITGFEEKPEHPRPLPGRAGRASVSMGVYVFKREVLIDMLMKDAAREDSYHDFAHDVIPYMYPRRKVCIYKFGSGKRRHENYWRDIGTIEAYWRANMDLASVTPEFNLYDPNWPIRTYQGQYPPAKTIFADEKKGKAGKALDSIICGGVIISGGAVNASVLSPGVRVNSYAEVSESILFHNVVIGMHAKIRRAIIDKDVRVPDGTRIGYDLEQDRKRFFVTDEGIVVIPKGAILQARGAAGGHISRFSM